MAKRKFNDISNILCEAEALLGDATDALDEVCGDCKDKKQKKLLGEAQDYIGEATELLQ